MVCRLQYWADAFASDGDPGTPPNLRDWASDTGLVTERLTEIDAVLAMMHAEAARQPISAMDFLRGKSGVLSGQAPPEPPPPPPARPELLRRLWQVIFGGARRR